MKRGWLCVALLVAACGRSAPLDEQFGRQWHDPAPGEMVVIGAALVKNKVGGCGEMQVRLPKDPTERRRLVRCSRDGKAWKVYLVNWHTDHVRGPLTAQDLKG